jgi:hypothetical protein
MINVTTAKTVELVSFYNAHAAKPVKKFSDRATAEKRVAAILETLTVTAPTTATGISRSEAIAKSWTNPETRHKRSLRHPVAVDGVEYTSVRMAFLALNLDLKKHIAFRVGLVEGGKPQNFGGHRFELI